MDGELEQLGERIAEQAAHFDAALHRLLTDLRDFDVRGGWHRQGAKSCAHWLSWRVGWDLTTARERVRVAGKLGKFPAVDDALRRGEVSYSKVRAMTRVATPANELLLLDYSRLVTASDLETLCRKYALVQRHGQESTPRDDEQRRYVRRRDTDDGMVKIEAVLHPEEAEMVWTMLDHAAKQLVRDPDRGCRIHDSAESPQVASANTTAARSPECHDAPGTSHDSAESQDALISANTTGRAVARVLRCGWLEPRFRGIAGRIDLGEHCGRAVTRVPRCRPEPNSGIRVIRLRSKPMPEPAPHGTADGVSGRRLDFERLPCRHYTGTLMSGSGVSLIGRSKADHFDRFCDRFPRLLSRDPVIRAVHAAPCVDR